MVKVIKVIKNETFTDKKGNERRKSFYALEDSESKNLIVIQPVHNDGYGQLNFIAEKRFQKKEEK